MRLLDIVTRDPLLKLTALILAFLLWALVETGRESDAGGAPPAVANDEDSAQARVDSLLDTRAVPVAVRLTGQPLAGWELAGPPRLEPPLLTVSGPLPMLERLDTLHLPSIRLDGRSGSTVLDIQVDTAGLGLNVMPVRVRVTIPIRPITPGPSGGGAAERPDPALAPVGAAP